MPPKVWDLRVPSPFQNRILISSIRTSNHGCGEFKITTDRPFLEDVVPHHSLLHPPSLRTRCWALKSDITVPCMCNIQLSLVLGILMSYESLHSVWTTPQRSFPEQSCQQYYSTVMNVAFKRQCDKHIELPRWWTHLAKQKQ